MKKMKNGIVLYKNKNGNVELRADVTNDTLWATQEQIAGLFNVDRTVVTKHIKNILKDKEIEAKSNVQKMHIPNSDKPIAFYSLDIILAVGYRTSSAKALKFRQWATKILREYIIDGHSLNKYKLEKSPENIVELHKAISFIESKSLQGKLKGTVTVKLSKKLVD